jgi:nicotinate-nucleotide adenylyltransferase
METQPLKFAVYGATFNPPHLGHLDAIHQLLDEYDHILLIPNASHAFGKEMLDFELRCELLRLLLDQFLPEHPKVRVSRIEALLHQRNPDQPVYTYTLLKSLKASLPEESVMHFVMGPDNAQPEKWQRFYRYDAIEAEFGLRVVSENLPIRSSQIREICQLHSDPEERVRALTPLCGESVANRLRYVQF